MGKEDVIQTLRSWDYRIFNGYGGLKCHFSQQEVKPSTQLLESGLYFATNFGELNSVFFNQGLKST